MTDTPTDIDLTTATAPALAAQLQHLLRNCTLIMLRMDADLDRIPWPEVPLHLQHIIVLEPSPGTPELQFHCQRSDGCPHIIRQSLGQPTDPCPPTLQIHLGWLQVCTWTTTSRYPSDPDLAASMTIIWLPRCAEVHDGLPA